jgi:hypothetical protein
MAVGHDVHLGQKACVFQVAVRDVTRRICSKDESSLDFSGEGLPPHIGSTFAVKVHITHASFGHIGCPQEGRFLRDDFS